jgi:hypothetical protein
VGVDGGVGRLVHGGHSCGRVREGEGGTREEGQRNQRRREEEGGERRRTDEG